MRQKNLNFDKSKIFKFFQDKKYDKISKLSKSILKTFSNDKEVHKVVIFSELNIKNINKANIVSEKLLNLIDDAETNYIHGNVLKLQSKFKESINFYQKAINYKKDYFEAYNNLASSQKNIGLKHEALKNYRQAIKIKPNNLEAHYNLANLFYDEKRFDEALANYFKVIQIDKNFPQSSMFYQESKVFALPPYERFCPMPGPICPRPSTSCFAPPVRGSETPSDTRGSGPGRLYAICGNRSEQS